MNSNSNSYEQDMLVTETYSQALTKGYLNPLGNNATYTQNLKDPYFFSGAGTGDLTAMQTILGNYQSGYSAWQIPLIVYHCNDQDNQTYVDNCLSGLTMNSPSCAPYKDMMWKLFRAMYLAKKQQLMESRFGGCNSTQLSTIINAYGKTRRHYAPADAGNLAGGTTGTGASDKAKADHKDQCESLCESYADVWMQQLSACDFTGLGSDPEVIKENLRASLIGVCVNGCDMKSPIGASRCGNRIPHRSFSGVQKLPGCS